MRLDVPLVLQTNGSVDCGLAGMAMVLQYFGKDDTLDDLKQDIPVDKVGTYAPQLGSYLLGRGFDVEIVTMHPKLFTLADQAMTQHAILERMLSLLETARDEQNKKTLAFFIEFLERGGNIRVGIPGPEHVAEEIKAKRPVCALLTTNFLKGSRPGLNYHFVVITGIDDQSIWYNDPLPDERGGKQQTSIRAFFYGLAASVGGDLDNGSLIRVKPR